jgi:hypothetical protein
MLQLNQQKKVMNYTAIKCKFLLISSLISQKNATTLNKKRPKSQQKGHILQDCTGPPPPPKKRSNFFLLNKKTYLMIYWYSFGNLDLRKGVNLNSKLVRLL